MKCIVFKHQDGSISLCHQLGESLLKRFDGDRDAALVAEMEKLLPNQPAGTTASIEDIDLIEDRTFRDAWALNSNRLEVDMPKARKVHRERMRVAREPKLAALDIDYVRADERDDRVEKQRIANQKQALRDVTKDPAIDSARTPEELKDVWPAVLEESLP